MDNQTPPEPTKRASGFDFRPRNLALVVGIIMIAVYVILLLASSGDRNGDGIITTSEAGLEWTRGIAFLIAGILVTVLAGIRIATSRDSEEHQDESSDK